jgi:hypothetical protein
MPSHESILSDGMHRKDDKPAPRWPVALVGLLGVAAVVVGIFATQGAGEVEDQRDTAVEQVRDLGRDVAAACARGEVIQSPDGRNLCQRAAEVQSDPVPGTVIQGERGPGPTLEQIDAAVTAYLVANPPPAGRPPTTAEVAAAVAEYLIANPPQPGRPPTAAEISDAVSAYFAANPVRDGQDGQDGRDGVDGKDGEPGRPPTAEEIDNAVAAYLAENPPPPGPTCPPGSSLQPVLFASGERGLGCVTEQAMPTTEPPSPTTGIDEPDGELLDGG